MKLAFASVLALTLCASPALAQTPPASSPAAPASTAAPTQAAPTQTAPKPRDVRLQCRAEAAAKGIKGKERNAAVQDCFAKAMPERAAAQKCRQDGRAKGLERKALNQFVRECRKQG